jgi:hypothetical protein
VVSVSPFPPAPPYNSRQAYVTLRVPVLRTASGWFYKGKALRLGEDFLYESPGLAFRGGIETMGDAMPLSWR